jgi:methylglutaconyl-CoA hydratase
MMKVVAKLLSPNDAKENGRGSWTLFENSSGRGENGDLRASERSGYEVREHRSAEKRHLQPAITSFRTSS